MLLLLLQPALPLSTDDAAAASSPYISNLYWPLFGPALIWNGSITWASVMFFVRYRGLPDRLGLDLCRHLDLGARAADNADASSLSLSVLACPITLGRLRSHLGGAP